MSALPFRPSFQTVTIVPFEGLTAVDGIVFSLQLAPGTVLALVTATAVVFGLMKLCPPSVDLPTAIELPGFQVAITVPLGRITGMENWPASCAPKLTVT